MEALLKTIVSGLVEDPASITVTVDEPNEEDVIVYHLLPRIWVRSSASRAELQRPFVPLCVPLRFEAIRRLQ